MVRQHRWLQVLVGFALVLSIAIGTALLYRNIKETNAMFSNPDAPTLGLRSGSAPDTLLGVPLPSVYWLVPIAFVLGGVLVGTLYDRYFFRPISEQITKEDVRLTAIRDGIYNLKYRVGNYQLTRVQFVAEFIALHKQNGESKYLEAKANSEIEDIIKTSGLEKFLVPERKVAASIASPPKS